MVMLRRVFSGSLPEQAVSIVSNLHVHLVDAWSQHREKTVDVCGRPVLDHTLLTSDVHLNLVHVGSQV